MSNRSLVCQDSFPLKKDDTKYYLLSSDYVSVTKFAGQKVLKVNSQALTLLAQCAFYDASFMLRPVHRQQVADILNDPEASENDKYVALQFLRDSDTAAKGILPTHQDTGIAIIIGKRGQHVWTNGGDEAVLVQGMYNACIQDNLCYLQNAPLDVYKEVNTGINPPAQINFYITDDDEYKFLCIVKGGGSTNKTYLYQETKVLITPTKLKSYLVEEMYTLGTAARPSYYVAFVIGEISAETALETVKLASIRYYDSLPAGGNEYGQAFCGMQLKQELLLEAQSLSLGAQFDGEYFAHDVRVVRLPRHDISYLVGTGVSCSANRNIKAEINRDGIWIERLEGGSGRYIPEHLRQTGEGEAVRVDLSQPMSEILALLSQYPVSIHLSLSSTIIVAHDIAHVKLKELVDSGEALPQYVKDHPIYYAGPAKTSNDYVSGSLGPTTAGRMGPHVDLLQLHGASKVMLAKGNCSQQVTDACHKHDGFYLGGTGDPVAVLVQQSIRSLECVAYPELDMETIWKIDVENFPAFILVGNKGNDFFQRVQTSQCARYVK